PTAGSRTPRPAQAPTPSAVPAAPGNAPTPQPAPAPTPAPAPSPAPAPRAEVRRDVVQWVLFDEGDAAPAISVAGDGAVDEARRARRGTEAMVWFRLDGKTYVSRDAELLTQLRGGHAEDRAAAARVAADVAELNARRARLAQEMAARAANRPDVDTTMLDEHKARVAQLAREMAAMRDQLHAGDTQA